MIALILLSGLVAKITKNYFDRKKGKNAKPLLSYDENQNEKMFIEEYVDRGYSYEKAKSMYEENMNLEE